MGGEPEPEHRSRSEADTPLVAVLAAWHVGRSRRALDPVSALPLRPAAAERGVADRAHPRRPPLRAATGLWNDLPLRGETRDRHCHAGRRDPRDRKSTRLNSSHITISY